MMLDALNAETQVDAYATGVDRAEARFAGAVAEAHAIDRQIAELAAAIGRLQQALDPADLRTAAQEIVPAAGGARLAQLLVVAMDHRGVIEDAVAWSLREAGVLTRRTQGPGQDGIRGPLQPAAKAWSNRLIALARLHGPRR